MSVAAELRWDAQGLIPAVVQEAETGEVLMVAWMDREALRATVETGSAHFWSRSRQALWRKGETSGHTQHVDALYADCDRDTLLLEVHQVGVACHTGARTCFFTRLSGDGGAPVTDAAGPATLEVVERVIQSRKVERPPGSYVTGLLERGEAQIARKIGEEAVEVVTAALGGEGDDRVVSEVADLWFHCMVLLGARGVPLRRVFEELARRHAERAKPGAGA
ncbi:MAG TPA: bifunctional phosphoribosyl-AMP cyclohydrolase/phosphoribosyl-ATP diphosphatase HisIE [Candidatus Limnocylindrales bacterium]|nr:bifunctional phosphoribosyl-AMP cyclohydrolase/phosphoribosyl-ATP diphosphatase HisIE [Candidatus Limnocylindrales bacterium]